MLEFFGGLTWIQELAKENWLYQFIFPLLFGGTANVLRRVNGNEKVRFLRDFFTGSLAAVAALNLVNGNATSFQSLSISILSGYNAVKWLELNMMGKDDRGDVSQDKEELKSTSNAVDPNLILENIAKLESKDLSEVEKEFQNMNK